jgi:hypothetical protein
MFAVTTVLVVLIVLLYPEITQLVLAEALDKVMLSVLPVPALAEL